jgi:D-amino-acid dehydrogenase
MGKETAPFLLRVGALPSMLSWGAAFLRNSKEQRWKDNTRAVWPLALLSRDILAEKTRELGLSYDLWEHGTLRIHEDAASMQAAESGLAVYRELGCEIRKLDQAACLDLEPALRPVARGILGGYQFPTASASVSQA